jgi:hexosaminidase
VEAGAPDCRRAGRPQPRACSFRARGVCAGLTLGQSHPDTIPTIRALWDEFLPWISSPVVSIGADEYDSAYADEYLDFVNDMSSYIKSTGHKSIRVWGTTEPSTTRSLATNITVQHWDFPDGSIPVQLMAKGYDVINSEQAFLYLDMKTSDDGQFPQTLDEPLLWASDWAPNIFSAADPSNNTSPHDPRLQGAIMALWNDWGNNASTPLEAYYALARSLPLLAEKTWNGAGVRTAALDAARFNATYPPLNAAAPGQNLNRAVKPPPGADGVVFAHDLSHAPAGTVVHTGVASVGPPYTLSFEVQDDPRVPGTATLFSGADSALRAGRLAFVDVPTNVMYPLAPHFALPTDRLARVVVRATREWTSAEVDGKEAVFWTTSMDIWGEYMAAGNMSFAAPSGVIGQAGSGVRFGRVELRLGV